MPSTHTKFLALKGASQTKSRGFRIKRRTGTATKLRNPNANNAAHPHPTEGRSQEMEEGRTELPGTDKNRTTNSTAANNATKTNSVVFLDGPGRRRQLKRGKVGALGAGEDDICGGLDRRKARGGRNGGERLKSA